MVPKAGNRVLDTPLTSSVWSPFPSENQAKQTGYICRGLRADPWKSYDCWFSLCSPIGYPSSVFFRVPQVLPKIWLWVSRISSHQVPEESFLITTGLGKDQGREQNIPRNHFIDLVWVIFDSAPGFWAIFLPLCVIQVVSGTGSFWNGHQVFLSHKLWAPVAPAHLSGREGCEYQALWLDCCLTPSG